MRVSEELAVQTCPVFFHPLWNSQRLSRKRLPSFVRSFPEERWQVRTLVFGLTVRVGLSNHARVLCEALSVRRRRRGDVAMEVLPHRGRGGKAGIVSDLLDAGARCLQEAAGLGDSLVE